MKSERNIRILFAIAAAYDGILGLIFLLRPYFLFERFGVTPPNHPGYVQFPAALLIVFAFMFAAVARDPSGNRNLIPYGILLKVSYCGTVFYHWAVSGVPYLWKPFAFADLLFLGAFLWAFSALARHRS
jgi:hypothetical protein